MSSSPESSRARHHDAEGLPLVSPDKIEEDSDLDNMIPTRGYAMTPMVGLGASAGGIQALVEFFKAMPVDSGMVFVVILHLSPTHESTLAVLLGRSTTMVVVQAEDEQVVLPNHVYVIPPGKYLTVGEGRLHLFPREIEDEPPAARGKRVAVDIFFRSLADSHGSHAMAVVLSGIDGDGAIGIKRVRERGGLTIAQDPSEAEHAGMPRSAIDTGMIDWVLKLAEIPSRLVSYLQSESKVVLPPEETAEPPSVARPSGDEAESALRDVLVFLRMRTGRDFTYYKRATILRRIGRRMQVNGVVDLLEYVGFLRTHPGEAAALLQDLLISVTNFFRDREAFEALEKRIPEVFDGKTAADHVRVWVPACATGEEAYSIAILLSEHARTIEGPPSVQVFACDLNDEAIQVARAGHYPGPIEADVTDARLTRFFVKDRDGYKVRRELREMVLFASHDLLKDPPFSRMDLISCRNLLIYLSRDAQQRVVETFHFAMKPGALLFLGTSEAAEEAARLFRPVDTKHRIYRRELALRIGVPVPLGTTTEQGARPASDQASAEPVVHGKGFPTVTSPPFQPTLGRGLDRTALAELHFKLVERYAPPSVIVDAEHEVVHLSEHAGSFLKFAGGEPTMSLMRVVAPELRVELRAALFRAAETRATVEVFSVLAEIDGRSRAVDLRVVPAPEIAEGYLLVVFEARDPGERREALSGDVVSAPDAAARHLERELEQVKGHLRDTVEQYEASTEELKASNEELQAMNEELRSATEELQTSREELQSINEELSTVNLEMKGKVEELANANSDLQNLMAATAIATVFLDRDLTIMLYTPSAAGIFNLIPGDVGRPLAHLKHKLDYPSLIEDAGHVLRSLVPVEREVSDDERVYLARLQPYRTVDDHIAGAVLTLVDITERNRATESLRQSEERMRLLIESARDWAIFTLDAQRRVSSWNTGAEAAFGYSEGEILGQAADVLFTAEDQASGEPQREVERAREAGHAESERWHVRKDGSTFFGSGSLMPLCDAAQGASPRGFVKIMRDLTDRKRAEEALREHLEELTRFNKVAVGRETRMIDLKREVNELCERFGEIPRYTIAREPEEGSRPA